MLAVIHAGSQGFLPKMKFPSLWALIAFAAASMALCGCAVRASEPFQAVSLSDRPFGGAPEVPIPSSAFAMGAYLKAEVASQSGDRAAALKSYEEAVQYDPHNPALHVQLATLYVRDGRLKDALEQSEAAIALDPTYVRARLLAAGISSALGDDNDAEQEYQKVMELAPTNQEAYLCLGTLAAKRGD